MRLQEQGPGDTDPPHYGTIGWGPRLGVSKHSTVADGVVISIHRDEDEFLCKVKCFHNWVCNDLQEAIATLLWDIIKALLDITVDQSQGR